MWEPARSAFLNEELSSLPHPHLRILSSFQRMAVEPHWPLWRDWGLLLNFFFFFFPITASLLHLHQTALLTYPWEKTR